MRGPKLNAVLEGWSLTNAGYRGKITCLILVATLLPLLSGMPWLSWPPRHAAGSCSAYSSFFFFCQAAFQTPFPEPIPLCGLVMTEVQHPALSLVGCHVTGQGLLIQSIQIILKGLPSLMQTNILIQFSVFCNLVSYWIHSIPSSK